MVRDDRLDGGNRDLFPDAGLIQPAFQARPAIRVPLFGHDDISFNLCRAVARSSGGVFFSLMKARR
jgi:hypothetical protein